MISTKNVTNIITKRKHGRQKNINLSTAFCSAILFSL